MIDRISMQKRYVYILLLFLSCTLISNAQLHFFRQYSLEDGLPQSEVNDMAEDKFGYLWLGTNGGGLCRFNGVDFEVLTKKDGLLENIVMGLHSDNEYNLWIASQKGISKYDGKDFKHIVYSDTTLYQERTQFLETIDGRVWALVREVTGERKLLCFINDELIDYSEQHKDIFTDNKIFFITQVGPKQILISSLKGIFSIEDGVLSKKESIGNYNLSSGVNVPILYDKYRNTWMLSFKSEEEVELLKISYTGEITSLVWPSGIPIQRIFSVYEDRFAGVWIAVAANGVVRYNEDGEYKVYNKSNGLKATLITCMKEDREGNMWFGTSGFGLLKYGGDKFVAFNEQNGLASNIVRLIAQDNSGTIYFGDDNNTITLFDGKEVKRFIDGNHSGMGQARSMVELANNKLLFGTLSGLYEYNKGSVKNVSKDYGLNPYAPVVGIIKDRDTLYLGVYGVGLVKYQPGKKTIWYTKKNTNINSSFITHIFKDSKGLIWVSSTSGVSVLKGQEFINYSDKDHLNAAWVLQAAEDKLGNIWLATFTGGLNRFDGKSFEYYDTSKGVTSDNIYSVVSDAEGNIWAGTQNGVDKITIGSDGKVLSIHNFDKDDGFIGIENNGSCNLLAKDGSIWFGTINGAMRYNPEEERVNYQEPPVYIRQVLLNFKKPDWTKENKKVKYDSLVAWFNKPEGLKLSHDNNHVAFKFDGLCFTVPEKTKYKWKLEPLETEWSPENELNMAFYPSLAPGNYTFRVVAGNNDGIWNEEGAEYSFQIVPAWHQVVWVRGLAILIIVLAIVFLIRRRIQKEEFIKQELESRLSSKKIEIQKQQSEIKNQNEILKEQKEQLQIQAESLQKAKSNLERLSQIGQLITSNLSVDKISDQLYHSVSKVMSTDVFSIGLYNEKEKSIDFVHSYLNGERQPFVRYLIEDKERLAIYSFTHNEEIVIEDFYKEYSKYIKEIRPVPQGAETESVIYIPLRTANDVIGVISVQSIKKSAYTSYHVNFLQNIANYSAIAIGNALKYQELRMRQDLLKNEHDNILGEKDALHSQKDTLETLNFEKSQLLSLFVKGIQEPLNVVLSQLKDFIHESSNCSEEQLSFLNGLIDTLRKQNDIINKVLEVHNIDMDFYEYQPQEIDVFEVTGKVIEEARIESDKKGVELFFKGMNLLGNLDMSLYMKVVENLIANAVKYSPSGKRVTILLSNPGDSIRLEVHDQGPGLSEEEKKNIFEKFSQMPKTNELMAPSSGLGLYIVKKYVTKMSGKVKCESVEGFGATFIVEFPLT